MGEASLGLTKFFVTNLPERCSSQDIGDFFSVFGEVVGVYVARKKDKKGNKFGFVSVKDVKDVSELEGRMKGAKMGTSKLFVNIAKFAVENSGYSAQSSARKAQTKPPEHVDKNVFNYRDRRSYRDVVGKNKVTGDSDKEFGGHSGGGVGSVMAVEKMVVVPDRTSAFKELYGSAVIGRLVDLETLVDFDKLLRIAKVAINRIQYLGGLSIIISFHDSAAANKFLDSHGIWGPWFSKLEAWGGQSLPMERVAWLSLHGIPLQLLEPDVLMQVGVPY
ncbi:putative RNA recognition motif domain, nucleotide-binding alpha-beta plait domain superfamily [Helianthus annuus]|uniref:RNA recognition motif domain, nucleotide-binding alpha-beta plait domain superfamily n=1 Tax=Helianthus annuus TaxID=4232 RepID=A0A9K3N367_HELAN|nr:putative RNA recognition motif domain, nucleotide-binding alpha-beta plait domain superfamily [Helianthus annuus]